MSTGIFDIIGPNMIGPSSSHTAGALRIAYLAGRLIHGGAKRVEFTLYGSFAHTYRGHGTDRALLAGVMGFPPDDLRIRHSFEIAEERGLQYKFRIDTVTEVEHPNTVGILLARRRRTRSPCDRRFGRGRQRPAAGTGRSGDRSFR